MSMPRTAAPTPGGSTGSTELPGLQKRIIKKTLEQNRIVITATQMMQSMVENPIPTRAEVLDVANAVIDGTDAVMLSAETAIGKHPQTVVEAMHRVCLGAERHCDTTRDNIQHLNVHFERIDQAIAMAAMMMATNVSIQAIVALTETGSTAQWLLRVRTSVPIFALSPLESSRRRMALYRDVYPIALMHRENLNQAIVEAIRILSDKGHIHPGDRVVLTSGDSLGNQGGTNTMRLFQVAEGGTIDYPSELDWRRAT